MRLTFFAVNHNLKSGGGSPRTLELKLRFLVSQGHYVTLVTLYSKGNSDLRSAQYVVDEQDISGLSFIAGQKEVVRIMNNYTVSTDLFYMNGMSFVWAAGMYRSQTYSKPVVAFINNYLVSMNLHHKHYSGSIKRRFKKLIKDRLYVLKQIAWEKLLGIQYINNVDVLYFASPVIQKIYRDWGVAASRCKVFTSFVDTYPFARISRIPAPDNIFRVLYVGRLSLDKGVDLLVEAINELHDKKIQMTIVGDGPLRKQLLRKIAEYNLSENICILPWATERQLLEYYARADVFVHPCRWPEPSGRTVLEALACGVPVITSSGTGSAWLAGEASLIFEKNDSQGLARQIITLRNSPQLQAQMSHLARERAAEFDYRNLLTSFEQQLIALIK